MERGERDSTRTSPCPVARRRSRRRRRGSTSPLMTTACAGSLSARSLISLEEMSRDPRVLPPIGAQAGTLMVEFDAVNTSRSTTRCLALGIWLRFVSLVSDAFVRAAAGRLLRGVPRAVEPVDDRAPLGVVLHPGTMTLRDDHAGVGLGMWILGRALRACAALFVNIRFWSTCFVAAVTLRLLVEGFERATKAGMFWIGPHSLLFEPCDDAAAPEEGGRGLRWRASDDELRHVLCMAARNALGWPVRGPARPRRRLDLSTVIEEGPRPSWGSVGRRSPVGAACRPGERERASRFLPQLERGSRRRRHNLWWRRRSSRRAL